MFDVDHRCRRGTGGGGALQRASARKHLPSSVRGLEARLEVSWFVVADGGSRSAWPGWRRWCAPCPLTCPRGLGWTAPRASVGSLSGLSLDACGLETTDAAVGLGRTVLSGPRACAGRRGTAHTAPGGLDPRLWGLDDGRALAPVAAAAVAWQPQPRAAAAPFRVGVRAWVSAVDGLLTGGYRSSPRVSV